MKLLTNIPQRRDGTVICRGVSGAKYIFTADASGVLTCDVDNDEDVGKLLLSEQFEPAEEADHDKAEVLLAQAMPPELAEDLDEDDEDDVAPDAPPLEANTPLVAAKPPKGKRAKG